MEDITFARAAPADLPAVRALLGRCDLPTEDLRAQHLEQFIVGRAGDELVGTIGIEALGEIGLLRSLAVAPPFRGRRLAHGLWTRAQDEARRRGLRRLYLLTTTAAELFARWGFRPVTRDVVPEPVQRTPEYSALCPGTAAVMVLDLETPALRAGARE